MRREGIGKRGSGQPQRKLIDPSAGPEPVARPRTLWSGRTDQAPPRRSTKTRRHGVAHALEAADFRGAGQTQGILNRKPGEARHPHLK